MSVKCGDVQTVEHATANATSLAFPQQASYTCEGGYSETGTVLGVSELFVACEFFGVITDPFFGAIDGQVDGQRSFNEQTSREVKVFGDEVTSDCPKGYTINGKVGGFNDFTVKCNAFGDFDATTTCFARKP